MSASRSISRPLIGLVAITLLMISALFSSASLAETKAATRIDFNKMIDENNMVKSELHKDVSAQTPVAVNRPLAAKRADDKSKVIDFIDVEIGVGSAPTVTDRRFDSIGAPVVVDIK